jgi:hypothetical protein
MVMTVMVFIRLRSLPIVAENDRAWRIFGTWAGNNGASSRRPAGLFDERGVSLQLRHGGCASRFLGLWYAGPVETRTEKGRVALPAGRLGREQPETEKKSDQRHTEQDPQLHLTMPPFQPLLFHQGETSSRLIVVCNSSRFLSLRECAPDDRFREAIQTITGVILDCFVALLLAMTGYRADRLQKRAIAPHRDRLQRALA